MDRTGGYRRSCNAATAALRPGRAMVVAGPAHQPKLAASAPRRTVPRRHGSSTVERAVR